ncbi:MULTISPECIES: aldehyde dehydrogenase family protein [Aneurinibacillus]|jgi:acyl-CoA reductase-like NAD-dependent aldehyde dehydrogenase|uniref:3-sulfolactaldehyde dehydrogenase n=1 Tax=Aneurinibacillus danicus TaxID=267746 RepID=A0A511V759_9BACL|nr:MULTISPECIES: aldehyde dehydrogenase family protein [Aneurinibacillus]GEN34777.1 NAD-dependent succinate-semialdehyde dehydrogenase [Aneurinibacillus danicus]
MEMIINKKKRSASNGKIIEVRNMATMEVIDTTPAATVQDAQEALEAARQGAEVWAATPVYKRVQCIRNFLEKMKERKEELARLLSMENGKILAQARAELDAAAGIFEGFAEESKRLFGQTIPLEIQEGLEKDLMITKREPLGVIVGILPFNFPAELFAHKVGSALAAGNAIIIKAPEDDPLTVIRMTEMLHEAGVPGNVLQIITGYGEEVGDYLAKSPLVNAVSFTGSTETGIHIAGNGAKNLSRVFLELGGNDAMIICEDADIDAAVQDAVDGRLLANGQVCCATKRILLHESVHDEFRDKLVATLSTKRLGNQLDEATDVGPLVSEEAAMRVEEQIQYTVSQGATLILGGKRVNSTFIEPTVLEGVTRDMDVAKDMEIFGPVFPLISFSSYEEAIEISNQSMYGLNGAIYTRDVYKAIDAGNRIQAGIVSVNGGNCYRPMCSAFGGYKKSGIGREGTAYTLEEVTQIKSIVLRGVM